MVVTGGKRVNVSRASECEFSEFTSASAEDSVELVDSRIFMNMYGQ